MTHVAVKVLISTLDTDKDNPLNFLSNYTSTLTFHVIVNSSYSKNKSYILHVDKFLFYWYTKNIQKSPLTPLYYHEHVIKAG